MIDPMAVTMDAMLGRLPGCSRLGPEALAALSAAATTVGLRPGDRLVTEGAPVPDWFALIEQGAVQLSRLDLEADEVLEYLVAGDLFDPGTPGLPAACSATATEPTRCRLVPQSLVARHRGALGVASAGRDPAELVLFVRRISELIKGPPVTCPVGATIAEAAQQMTRRSVGSVVVLSAAGHAVRSAPDRDLRTRVVAKGVPGHTPVETVMSSPVATTEPERLAFDALFEMTRRGIHHLAVAAGGHLLGVVSSHDIMLLQAVHPVVLVREIETATSLDELAATAPRVQSVLEWLAGEGASPFDIGRIIAELNDRVVRRALDLVVAELEAQGAGRPPLPYAWLAAGSEGR